MPIKIIKSHDTMVIALSGELDHHSAAGMRNAADRAIIESPAKRVTLDFGEVSFMDSSGVGFVMGRYRIAKSRGASIEAVNLSKKHMRIMKMSGIGQLLPIKEAK